MFICKRIVYLQKQILNIMNTDLKIGDRVNVETNITREWQSKYECKNAFISKIEKNCYLVSSDENTIYSKNGNTPLGWLYPSSYLITKI